MTATDTRFSTGAADAAVVFAFGNRLEADALPKRMRDVVQADLKTRTYKGGNAETMLVPVAGGDTLRVVAVVGLGTKLGDTAVREAARRGVARAVVGLRSFGVRTVSVLLPEDAQGTTVAGAALEGAALADYRFVDHSATLRTAARRTALRKVTLHGARDQASALRTAVKETKALIEGASLARDLVNHPAGHMMPSTLVEKAREIAAASPQISVRVLNRTQAQQQGFTAFLAVAQGSTTEPYVIHLTYKPTNVTDDTRSVALVGKGITFDSGGLSLKPAEYMEDMKTDMAGAAAVLGTFAALDKTQPDGIVHGIIATCENMPSGDAYRPGDVITAKDGTTIEVRNTDAEGRLTLADALVYAQELDVDAIVDLATLTGACVVALGDSVAGLWSNDRQLAGAIKQASAHTGEQVQQLPLPSEYRDLLKSTVADISNISSSRYGGAITAALFLREFIQKTPWVHLDIAGPSFATSSILPYWPKGGTGFGVRTLLRYLDTLAAPEK